MKINQLASHQNLKLAWRRITTGGNQQYKRLYRGIYQAYEIALDSNLRDLRQRLLGGSFEPCHPERIYVPKPSGLHRPLALLTIEDQIVLQSFANLAAKRIQPLRTPLQSKIIFSNLLEKPESIFFFRRWQITYQAFQRKVERNFLKGMRWVGDFDLAAFYDTISHELLLKTIFPRTSNSDIEWIKKCLRIWSSDNASSGHGHGLPQGPLASDFLAECFLLPIDQALKKYRGYMRYVDDVRLFGYSEDEVRAHLIELEQHCRERGLIPQAGKFAIKCADNLKEAMGMLPSIADPQHETGSELINKEDALNSLRSALDGKPYRVIDKTRLRYVLYRAKPDNDLLNIVLRLVPRHPEHTDAFFAYLGRFEYRKPIERLCINLIMKNPYPYLRGEAWHVLSRYQKDKRSATSNTPKFLTDLALTIVKKKTHDNFIERWGVSHFLCVAEALTSTPQSSHLKGEAPILQSLLAPVLPDGAFGEGKLVAVFLKRMVPEPGLSVCALIHQREMNLATFGLTVDQLPSQVANTLRELGVVSGSGPKIDPIAEILHVRYGVPKGKSWKRLLGTEYQHAVGILKRAEATFDSGRSNWLVCQNSFNQTVFLAIQRHLNATGHPAACTITNKNGQLIDFGVTLDINGPFSKTCPIIGGCFKDMNTRRNHIPLSHPYEKQTALQSTYLSAKDRNKFVVKLKKAYADFVRLMP